MDHVNLGWSGLKVSRLCLGCMSYGAGPNPAYSHAGWVLDETASRPFYRAAIEAEITFFDTADVYGDGASEEILGRAIREFTHRDEAVIATKVRGVMGPSPNDSGLSRKHIMASIDASLRRLGTDYVDLYQIHRWDYATPIEETMAALHDVVKAGKARYIGASSMFAWQFAKAQHVAERHGWTRFISMQPQYNLIYREEEREMLPLCRDQGVGVIPWSPMARGFLAGNRARTGGGDTERARTDPLAARIYYTPEDFAVADRVAEVAAELGVASMQVALAWVLARPGVAAPIIGATRMDHLQAAIGALKVRLSDDQTARLEAPYRPHAVLDKE
ncbi:MAG: aldo/keto reductase [Caulobacter sp.]|nr:aldo/keto reductase [Caulobacter sp.]